ncbi:hypothetical protein B296_00035493 [Ensete ventricosum]|uniref:Uncharacterized protein n=1 Tax=Ensete ventricosum TaxID=4639 RepID=A0A426Y3L4_ENSVE|nr:hypothetical protein B296_00035493 [Ensete ventricosum]
MGATATVIGGDRRAGKRQGVWAAIGALGSTSKGRQQRLRTLATGDERRLGTGRWSGERWLCVGVAVTALWPRASVTAEEGAIGSDKGWSAMAMRLGTTEIYDPSRTGSDACCDCCGRDCVVEDASAIRQRWWRGE